jgi:hypothetical protein
MSLNRYENLRRYLHISPPNALTKPDAAQAAFGHPQSCLRDPEDLEFWWWRLEPMLSVFCDAVNYI